MAIPPQFLNNVKKKAPANNAGAFLKKHPVAKKGQVAQGAVLRRLHNTASKKKNGPVSKSQAKKISDAFENKYLLAHGKKP